MFNEKEAMRQLLSLKKRDVVLLHLDNEVTLRVKNLEDEEYSILPFYRVENEYSYRLYPLIYDEVGYGLLHTCSIINYYDLKENGWAKAHLKK